jgi:hypothetical protein
VRCLRRLVKLRHAALLYAFAPPITEVIAVNKRISGQTESHAGAMPDQLVGDAAADAVQEKAEAGVLEDRAMPGRGEPLEVSGGVLVGRAPGSEG